MQNEWVKVHAAEYLLWAGYPEEVQEVFLQEEKQFGSQAPYRIGIWRVLAQAASSPDERKIWINKITEAFQDTNGKDRIHAAETLAKLKQSPGSTAPEVTRQSLESTNRALALYTLWATAYSSTDSIEKTREHLLANLASNEQDPLSKRMTGYILRQLGNLTRSQWARLAQVAVSEPLESAARIYLLSAAYVSASVNHQGSDLFNQIRTKLLEAKTSSQKGDRTEMAMALAERGTADDILLLHSLLTNQNPLKASDATLSQDELKRDPDHADVRAAAAYALLRIGQRTN